MVNLTRLGRLNHERDLCTLLLCDEVVVAATAALARGEASGVAAATEPSMVPPGR